LITGSFAWRGGTGGPFLPHPKKRKATDIKIENGNTKPLPKRLTDCNPESVRIRHASLFFEYTGN
jgi:hypothetical protein